MKSNVYLAVFFLFLFSLSQKMVKQPTRVGYEVLSCLEYSLDIFRFLRINKTFLARKFHQLEVIEIFQENTSHLTQQLTFMMD